MAWQLNDIVSVRARKCYFFFLSPVNMKLRITLPRGVPFFLQKKPLEKMENELFYYSFVKFSSAFQFKRTSSCTDPGTFFEINYPKEERTIRESGLSVSLIQLKSLLCYTILRRGWALKYEVS